MLCAHLHPYIAMMFTWIDNSPPIRKVAMRTLIVSVCSVVGYFWFIHIYCLPKIEYNKVGGGGPGWLMRAGGGRKGGLLVG